MIHTLTEACMSQATLVKFNDKHVNVWYMLSCAVIMCSIIEMIKKLKRNPVRNKK